VYTHIHTVATKTINLTEGSYSRLAALKREGESFSEVVDRITGKFALRDLVGVLDDRKAEAVRRAKRDFGKRLRKGMDRTAKR
jgi:predicted CopG family antitoxin